MRSEQVSWQILVIYIELDKTYCYNELLKIKFVTYSSQGSHTGQLDFCNWLAHV